MPVTPRPSLTPQPGQPEPTVTATNPAADLPADLALQLDEIESQVEQLRGLQPLYDVPRYILSREELGEIVQNDFFDTYTPDMAHSDSLTLAAWGLVEPGLDMLDLYTRLYTEQIAGFYDDEKKAMYVIQGSEFLGTDRQTYAHEYAHALQDMYYDMDTYLQYNDEYCQNHSDPCGGVQALVEGDAAWVGNEWLIQYGTDQDFQDLLDFAGTYESPVFDTAPLFLRESFLFPYQKGLGFIQTLIDREGPSVVDQIFSNPPSSTEQILHPDRYPADQPQAIELPDLAAGLGEDWRKVDDDSLGEWSTSLILTTGIMEAARLPAEEAENATTGWDGDRYLAYVRDRDDAVLLVMAFAWDTDQDVAEFFSAMRTYGDARWGQPVEPLEQNRMTWLAGGQAVQVTQDQARVTWILAPDAQTLEIASNLVTP
jgi:hypothetical protein